MRLVKPKFWDKSNSLFAVLLLPITLVVLFYIFLRKKFIRSKNFNIPIICIGNIYLGGTGKTPSSIFLAKELQKLNKNPVIIRKYYNNHIDEHKLIKENFKNLIIENDREKGIRKAEELNYDSVILDDGFQDYKIKKNLNIICFNQNQLAGNGFVLPSGPLRESLNSLKRANIVLINGKKDKNFESKIFQINESLEIFYSKFIPKNLDILKGKKLLALAAIGNPDNFFNTLMDYNLKIYKKKIFPDHYVFTKSEIESIKKEAEDNDCDIVMTEKDYFKVKDFNLDNIRYLKVSLIINEKERLLNKILKLYDKKN